MALPVAVRHAVWLVLGMLSPDYLNQKVIHKIVFATRHDLEKLYVTKEKNGKNMCQILGKYTRVPSAAHLINFATQVGVLVACLETGESWLDISDKDDVIPIACGHRAILQSNSKDGCWMCGAENAHAQCGKCMCAKYCGEACQRRHWPTHKGDCRPVESILG